MTRAAAALACILACCGMPDGTSTPYAPVAAPQRVLGCAGTGYPGGATWSACSTLSGLTATASDLATACSSGWSACAAPPAGCGSLPAFYLGTVAWRPVGGTDNTGTCGPGPVGSVQVALGCGAGAQRSTAPRCGGWTEAADLPWGRGVLCCLERAP